MSHLRLLSTRNKTSVISSLIFLLLAISIRQIETESSAEDEIPLGPSCTSADEFAAPAYGHCLPMQKCTAIHSGSNSPKFRLIIKALLCGTTDELPIGENPKICCPDPRTNNIGGVSNTATIGDPDTTVQANIEQEVHSETKTNDNDDDDDANDESGELSHETGVDSTTRPNQITVVDVSKIDMREYTSKVKEENEDSAENDGIVQDDDKKEVELEDDGNETKTGKSQEAFTSTNDEQEVHKEDSKGDTSDVKTHETNEKSNENSEEHQKNDETKVSLVSANNEEEKGQNNENIAPENRHSTAKTVGKSLENPEEPRKNDETKVILDSTIDDQEKIQNNETPAPENSDIAAKIIETERENPEEPQKNDETKVILDSTNDDQEKIQNNETPAPENSDIAVKTIETEMENTENQEEPQKKDETKISLDSTNYNNEEKFQNEDALKSEEIDIRSTIITESGTDKLISPIHEVDVQNDASHGVTLELEDEHNTASELQDDENEEEKSQNNIETTMSPFSDYANANTEIPEKTLFEKDDEKLKNPEESLNEEKTEIESENAGDDGQGTEENSKSHEVVDTTTDKAADATEISGITAKIHVGDDESVESRGDPPEDEVTTMGAMDVNNEPVDSNNDSNSSSDNNTEAELDGEGTLTHTVTETGLYHMDGSSQVEYEIAFGPTHL